ncbi:MAG TPA: hypothetical protein DCW60_03010 [Sutterella sp.]|nr:hypothetical protein [Sutterella sp.]
MQTIGIISGGLVQEAFELKGKIFELNPSLVVFIDEEEILAPKNSSAYQILTDDAVRRLIDKGASLIAFADGAVHGFFDQLQDELTTRLIDPCDASGEKMSIETYAERIVRTPHTSLPKPFRIGVVGGLGPFASADMYQKLCALMPAKADREHLKIIIDQNPQTPDRTKCLIENGENPSLALYRSCKRLEASGCDVIAVACNTAHAFLPEIFKHLSVTLVDMQKTALVEIVNRFGRDVKIGLLATTGTVESGLYTDKALELGINLFTPDEKHQELVMRSIYGPEGVKAGFTTGQCAKDLSQACVYLAETFGCTALILGCTELPLIFAEGQAQFGDAHVNFIDPTAAVARKLIALGLRARNESGRF